MMSHIMKIGCVFVPVARSRIMLAETLTHLAFLVVLRLTLVVDAQYVGRGYKHCKRIECKLTTSLNKKE